MYNQYYTFKVFTDTIPYLLKIVFLMHKFMADMLGIYNYIKIFLIEYINVCVCVFFLNPFPCNSKALYIKNVVVIYNNFFEAAYKKDHRVPSGKYTWIACIEGKHSCHCKSCWV